MSHSTTATKNQLGWGSWYEVSPYRKSSKSECYFKMDLSECKKIFFLFFSTPQSLNRGLFLFLITRHRIFSHLSELQDDRRAGRPAGLLHHGGPEAGAGGGVQRPGGAGPVLPNG